MTKEALTDEEVRESYASGVNFEMRTPLPTAWKDFDAWLRKVQAYTLRDFAKTLDTYSGTVLNADSAANMARVTANGIEGVSR